MATDITRQAGKGLQKQLMVSNPVYRERYDQIFDRKPVAPVRRGPQSMPVSKTGLRKLD